jgi:hypothetical protein
MTRLTELPLSDAELLGTPPNEAERAATSYDEIEWLSSDALSRRDEAANRALAMLGYLYRCYYLSVPEFMRERMRKILEAGGEL